jgi:hypothetical protein
MTDTKPDLAALDAAATAAPWRDVLVRTSVGRCHKILGAAHTDDEQHGYPACIYDDDTSLDTCTSEKHAADAALIVRLRNAYAAGDLIPRERFDSLVEAAEGVLADHDERVRLWVETRPARVTKMDRLRAALASVKKAQR